MESGHWDVRFVGEFNPEDYKDYDEFSKAIIAFYRSHTNKQAQAEFDCSWQMIYGACKHMNYSKSEDKRKQKTTSFQPKKLT